MDETHAGGNILDLLDRLANVIRGRRYAYTTEEELHQGLELAMVQAGLDPCREVMLTKQDRVDFMVGRIAVEVKIKGSRMQAMRQVIRYARSDKVAAVLLVGTKMALSAIPDQLGGKPVRGVVLLGSML